MRFSSCKYYERCYCAETRLNRNFNLDCNLDCNPDHNIDGNLDRNLDLILHRERCGRTLRNVSQCQNQLSNFLHKQSPHNVGGIHGSVVSILNDHLAMRKQDGCRVYLKRVQTIQFILQNVHIAPKVRPCGCML